MSATKYIDYLTKDGDTWDNISFSQYGDVSYMGMLILANPHVPADVVLAGGVRLLIPVINKDEVTTETAKLPRWKQALSNG